MDSPRQPESESSDYWKKQAKYYEQKANDIQQELDEYTENSAQLEKELEASLVQVEKQNRDLEHQNQRLKNEIENLRNKLERSQHETNALESELQALKKDKEKQAVYIRELEQKNDDLERAQRVISETVSCIETMLNETCERNAVLESEVDELDALRERLQRATDEARDLKQELKVKELVPPLKKEEELNSELSVQNGIMNNPARTRVEIETQTSLSSPLKREINGNAMTPSARVSAINIVGDLLRKVGLERFLCRECGKIKCACNPPTAGLKQHMPTPEAVNEPDLRNVENNTKNDSIEYRNFDRQNSGPERASHLAHKPPLPQRSLEQPFVRSSPSENGKLRRSFAVRSREGLENLFNFSSNRKGHDQQRSKETF